jgi:hypothetical protein
MGVAAPLVSPYVQEFADYLGRAIRVAVTFDNTTRLISQIIPAPRRRLPVHDSPGRAWRGRHPGFVGAQLQPEELHR